MIIKVDDKVLFELNETQKKVIKNDIKSELFEADMHRRLQYILEHKYERCFKRLKAEWEPVLAERVESLPTDKDAFAELVFAQPDYKDRSTRDLESKN